MTDLYANWAQVYDTFYPVRTGEVEFWSGVACSHGFRLLDLMCGTAEVTLGLACGGFATTGIDRSAAMLGVAAGRLADAPAMEGSLCLSLGEACAIPAADGAFDFALVGGNGSFNHLDDAGAARAFRELSRVLRPGGGLGLELVNPFLLGELTPTRTIRPFRPLPGGLQAEQTVTNRYDRATGLLHIHQVTRQITNGGTDEFEDRFALRAWSPGQVREMLLAAGFAGIRFHGDYELEPFGQWSSDLLVLACNTGETRPQVALLST